jgi:hypothetical protein
MKDYKLHLDNYTMLCICFKQKYIHILYSKNIGKIVLNKN